MVDSVGVDKDNEDLCSITLSTCRMPKNVHTGSQRLQNIAGYGFPSKQMEQSQTKIPKTKVHELSRVQK